MQAAFVYLQGDRLQNLSGLPVPVLSHPHNKEVLHHVQTKPLVLQFYLLLLVLPLDITEKSPAPSSVHPSFRYLKTWITSPLSFVFSKMIGHSSQTFTTGERLQTLHHHCSPSLDCFQYIYFFPV